MTERTELWWITSAAWGLPDPTPARVTYRDGMPSVVLALGQDERFRPEDVRLIERVLPPGRVGVAVTNLEMTLATRCGDDIHVIVEDVLAMLQAKVCA